MWLPPAQKKKSNGHINTYKDTKNRLTKPQLILRRKKSKQGEQRKQGKRPTTQRSPTSDLKHKKQAYKQNYKDAKFNTMFETEKTSLANRSATEWALRLTWQNETQISFIRSSISSKIGVSFHGTLAFMKAHRIVQSESCSTIMLQMFIHLASQTPVLKAINFALFTKQKPASPENERMRLPILLQGFSWHLGRQTKISQNLVIQLGIRASQEVGPWRHLYEGLQCCGIKDLIKVSKILGLPKSESETDIFTLSRLKCIMNQGPQKKEQEKTCIGFYRIQCAP